MNKSLGASLSTVNARLHKITIDMGDMFAAAEGTNDHIVEFSPPVVCDIQQSFVVAREKYSSSSSYSR